MCGKSGKDHVCPTPVKQLLEELVSIAIAFTLIIIFESALFGLGYHISSLLLLLN